MSEPCRGRAVYRLVLTPAGAGILSLFFPGLLIAAVSRQRYVVALSIGAGLLLLVNAVIARLALSLTSVTVSLPPSATTGEPAAAAVDVGGPAGLEVLVGLDRAKREWVPAVVPSCGDVETTLPRGVVDSVSVQVQTAVPFGLTAFVRRSTVSLGRPCNVAPAPIAVPLPTTRPDGAMLRGRGHADPAGVRPFVAGDRQREVHWRTVARTGELVVLNRTADDPDDAPITVVVDTATDERLEQALGAARSVVESLLGGGNQVILETYEQRQAAPPPSHRPDRGVAERPLAARLVAGAVPDVDTLSERLAMACAADGAGGRRRAMPGEDDAATLVVGAAGARWASHS